MNIARSKPGAGALTIALVYAGCGGLWILVSDRALALLVSEPGAFLRASILKGWFFIGFTTVVVYLMARRFARQLGAAHQQELSFERERRQPPPMLVAIADASTDVIYAKDEEGRYLLFNNAAAAFVGRTAAELIGKDDLEIFPDNQARRIMAVERRIRETGQPDAREDLVSTVVGERVFFSTMGPLRGADGRIFGTYGIARDVTERKRSETQLRESQTRLRLLVTHAPVALAMFDRDMRYLEASPLWVDTFSVGGDRDLVGRLHYELSTDLPEAWKDAHARGLAGETHSAEEDLYRREDGRQQWVRWEVRPWFCDAGVVGGIVIFAEDITQRRAAELELKQRNQELERFNAAAIERELRMIALKREINEMARQAGQTPPYEGVVAEVAGAPATP